MARKMADGSAQTTADTWAASTDTEKVALKAAQKAR
jgi:hypothetical protein